MQTAINELVQLGKFPSSTVATAPLIKAIEIQLSNVKAPISDDEAKALVKLFGPDDCFGLAWTLLHLIETSANWPIEEALVVIEADWANRLRERI